ncbi:MAG: hypothetical protein IK081_13275 [Lachnospiraceae bacterium]|nr:hypothetical protein [Lachnospiraceae bacterium]
MKKAARCGVLALAAACVINWSYVSQLLDLESQAVNSVFQGQGAAACKLQQELESLTVWKLVNPDVLTLLPEGYESYIPESVDDLNKLNETFSDIVNN